MSITGQSDSQEDAVAKYVAAKIIPAPGDVEERFAFLPLDTKTAPLMGRLDEQQEWTIGVQPYVPPGVHLSPVRMKASRRVLVAQRVVHDAERVANAMCQAALLSKENIPKVPASWLPDEDTTRPGKLPKLDKEAQPAVLVAPMQVHVQTAAADDTAQMIQKEVLRNGHKLLRILQDSAKALVKRFEAQAGKATEEEQKRQFKHLEEETKVWTAVNAVNDDLVIYQVGLFGKGAIEAYVKRFRMTEEAKPVLREFDEAVQARQMALRTSKHTLVDKVSDLFALLRKELVTVEKAVEALLKEKQEKDHTSSMLQAMTSFRGPRAGGSTGGAGPVAAQKGGPCGSTER
jgi:hypothetical protein